MLNEARFNLLMDSAKNAAELMAECSLCGAITTQPLALAWFEGAVECSNCGISTPLRGEVLDKLRAQAIVAQAAIDGLARQPSSRG